jgi:hypothetical protein
VREQFMRNKKLIGYEYSESINISREYSMLDTLGAENIFKSTPSVVNRDRRRVKNNSNSLDFHHQHKINKNGTYILTMKLVS